MFGFRRCDKNDIPVIQEIANKTWPDAYGVILGEAQIEYMLRLFYNTELLTKQINEGQYYYLVYQDNEVVGFAAVERIDNSTAKLQKLYVLPQFQQCGAGTALLQFMLNKARSIDVQKLVLNVNRYNKARHFYERNGFEVTREEDNDIGEGFFMIDYVMTYHY